MTRFRLQLAPWIRGLLALALLLPLAALLDCSGRKKAPQTVDEKKGSPVAQTGPKLEPLRPVPPARVRERVPSQGDCAPLYKVGGKGTCINNQPCRGFGVKGDNGKPICTCYGRDGGCAEGQRCDALRLACVPESEPPFGRGQAQ